jgi:F-type H+-transporting ATPase subunit delta
MTAQEIAARLYLQINNKLEKNTDLGLVLISAFGLLQNANLEEVLAQYNKILKKSIEIVEVISAKEIEKATQSQLEDKLVDQFGKNIVILFDIDTSLLGGMIIRSGDNVIDESIKSKIENVKI